MAESNDPTGPDPEIVAEVERVCDRAEAAWRAGRRPHIEDELAAAPGPARGALLRELILLELAYRRKEGERPGEDEYLARFPNDAGVVRSAFARAAPTTLAGPDGSRVAEPTGAHAAGAGLVAPSEGRDPTEVSRVCYFGDYELRGVLGRGGMGVVYRAEQVSLRRPVALKMIRGAALASEEERRRFRNEAEIAASLDHPHVVPVYEVGEHEGQPYLTMRLIPGEALDGRPALYRDRPREAARLVSVAARAVHHAHQRGVLHRDLKPANILVDDRGEPFVTDFGLARLVEGGGDLTETGAVLGTPAYMAPEQAEGRRGATTTATDVHGLGAILYALLTGRAPFAAESVPAILERVRTSAPDRPSRLNAGVGLDLEVICLTCLEKDPGRRYASAEALADDLDRFLGGEPIRARRVGRLVRLGMWARRRPAVAALTAALALVVVAGLAGLAWEWRQALIERDRAVAVRRFLTDDLLAQAAPERNARSRDVTLLEVLDRASARINGAFPGRPEVEATIRLTIGDVYVSLGEYRKGAVHLRRARDLFARDEGASSLDALSATSDLGVALNKQGRRDEAEDAFRRALDGLRRTRGPSDAMTLAAMSRLGDFLREANRLDEAEPLLREAHRGLLRASGPSDPATIRATCNLALVAHVRGRLDEATPLYREAIASFRRAGKTRHPEYLVLLNNLAILLQARGDRTGAEAAFREALAARREVLGPDHPDTLMAMNNLADFLQAGGASREAEALLRQALQGLDRPGGPGRSGAVGAMIQNNLADLLAARGDRAGALPLYDKALVAARAAWGPDHPHTRTIEAHRDEARRGPGPPAR